MAAVIWHLFYFLGVKHDVGNSLIKYSSTTEPMRSIQTNDLKFWNQKVMGQHHSGISTCQKQHFTGEGIQYLQSIQNAAARLVTGAKKFDHITPVLRELHWLPIRQCIAYMLSLLVYKCLHNAASVYVSSDCVPVSSLAGRRLLRSSVSGTLDSQRTRTVLDRRAFTVCDPATWNALPIGKKLKTCLFESSY